jgi:putative membrane protein
MLLEGIVMMSEMGWGWGGMIFGPIIMIVVLVLVVTLVVLLVRWLVGPGHGGVTHNPLDKTPLDILKERFAKGDRIYRKKVA